MRYSEVTELISGLPGRVHIKGDKKMRMSIHNLIWLVGTLSVLLMIPSEQSSTHLSTASCGSAKGLEADSSTKQRCTLSCA